MFIKLILVNFVRHVLAVSNFCLNYENVLGKRGSGKDIRTRAPDESVNTAQWPYKRGRGSFASSALASGSGG